MKTETKKKKKNKYLHLSEYIHHLCRWDHCEGVRDRSQSIRTRRDGDPTWEVGQRIELLVVIVMPRRPIIIVVSCGPPSFGRLALEEGI